MTPEKRLIFAAKTVARTKHLHEAADKAVKKQWAARCAALAAVEKECNAACAAVRKGRETTYQNLSAAQIEYDDALVAFHLAAVEVQP